MPDIEDLIEIEELRHEAAELADQILADLWDADSCRVEKPGRPDQLRDLWRALVDVGAAEVSDGYVLQAAVARSLDSSLGPTLVADAMAIACLAPSLGPRATQLFAEPAAMVAIAWQRGTGGARDLPRIEPDGVQRSVLRSDRPLLVPALVDAAGLVLAAGSEGGPVVVTLSKEEATVCSRACAAMGGQPVSLLDVDGLGLAPGATSDAAAAPLLDRFVGLLVSEQLIGIAERVIKDTVDYVGSREQFGRPLGTLQAVQHAVARATIDLDAAIACLGEAWPLDLDDPTGAPLAHLALGTAARAAVNATIVANQLWGGTGYAVENTLHLWAERARRRRSSTVRSTTTSMPSPQPSSGAARR